MNQAKVLKFMVLLLSILTAHLVTGAIDNYVLKYKYQFNPYIFTWIGMLLVVMIYYPLFTQIDNLSTKFSNWFLRTGKKVTGRRTGIFIFFLLATLVLYYFYGLIWFDINVVSKMFYSFF
ncbi:MAG: hypothetical protein IPO21_08335 [Bacteroidales bacterium]|nr:hypothetical protein [Bacteroidales bacterium]